MPLTQDDLRLWKRRLYADQAAQAVYHPRWRQAIQLFDTSYWENLKADNPELVAVNYATTFITTLVSAIFARAPKWQIAAKRPGKFYQFAETMTVLLEQFKDEEHFKEIALRCVVDAATCNIGWVEQGFFASIDAPIPQPETGMDDLGIKRRMQDLLTKLTKTAPDVQPAQQGELHSRKQPGQFYLCRRSPFDVFVPEGCYEYDSLPYLIVRERLTWQDFLDNPRYTNQERVGVLAAKTSTRRLDTVRTSPYPSGSMFNGKAPAGVRQRDPDRPVELYHIWDRRSQSVFTVSEFSDQPHEEPTDWPYLAEGFPLHPLQMNYVPEIPDQRDNFYGFSDLDPILAQVLEKSELRTQQSMIRRRATVKVFVQEGSATESQLAKVQSPDIEIIPVANLQAMQVSQPIQIPPAVLELEDIIDKDLSRDSGMALLLADASQLQKVERATVANIAQQSSSIKTSYKVDRIEAWVKAIGIYRVGLTWQFMTADEVGERLGHVPSGQEWIPLPTNQTLARQWIAKELLLTTEAGSTKPLTTDIVERDQYFKSLAILQQIDPLLFSQISRQAIAIGVKKFNEPALEQLVLAALDPQEQQAAMMENQLMQQGMPQVVGPHDDHQTHLQVHGSGPPTPINQAHQQAHQIRLQELAGATKTAGQGVRQQAAAPSAAEINQGGITRSMDVQGASMNQGPGAQAQAGAG